MKTSIPSKNIVSSHRQAQKQADALLRDNVVAAAARLLIAEGAGALTVRRIAQELDCSTKILYTLFAGKEGLANALYQAGCVRLGDVIGAVSPPPSNASVHLHAVANAYWQFAVEYPAFYQVMFCGAIPGFRPNESSVGSTLSAFETVRDAVAQYIVAGEIKSGEATAATAGQIVKTLWASLHGVLSLHLLGHFGNGEEAQAIYERTSLAVVAALVSPTAPASEQVPSQKTPIGENDV